jgi:hypothetical protein
MPGLVDSLFDRCGWQSPCPDLELAPFDNVTGSVGLHFQDDPPRGCQNIELLPPRNTRRPPLFPGENNPV